LESQQKKNIQFTNDLGFTFTSAFEDAVLSGGRLRDVLKGLEQDIARIILRRAVTQPLAQGISAGLAQLFTSGFGSSAPAMAGGGSVSAGMPYIVGEHGREAFVPAVSGSIVPNHELGGVTINQSIYVDSRSDQASIRVAMIAAKDQAIAEIRAIQRSTGESRI
jgi:hypothetical protein